MKILVCIKQVPNTTTVAVDETTGTLKRDGVESKMNPYDLYALEAAFRIREEHGGSVTVLSMGPAQAKAVLQEALHMGADHACLLTDRKFAGADVLATSYTLAQGIHQLDEVHAPGIIGESKGIQVIGEMQEMFDGNGNIAPF